MVVVIVDVVVVVVVVVVLVVMMVEVVAVRQFKVRSKRMGFAYDVVCYRVAHSVSWKVIQPHVQVCITVLPL